MSAGATGELPAGFFGAGIPAEVALLLSAGVRMRVAVTSVLEASIANAPSCIGGVTAAAASPVAGLVWAGGTAASGVAVALPAVAATTGVLGGETAGYEAVGTEAATSGLPTLPPATVVAAAFVAAAGVPPPLWLAAVLAASCAAGALVAGGAVRAGCETDDDASVLLPDAALLEAAVAATLTSAVRVGGTAA